MIVQKFGENVVSWFETYYQSILITLGLIVISYLIFFLAKRRVQSMQEDGRINEGTAENLISLIRITIIILALSAITVQYREHIGIFTNVWTVAGGTVLGFAAINTIGNLIAGLIVMITKPFEVGDRIEYKGRMADVLEIKLIYTVMEDIDGVKISVPNQKLIKEEIENYGKDKILRRKVFITGGYDEDPDKIEEALLEATKKFKAILKFPEPRVDLYEYQDFCIKYRMIVFINNSKIIPKFDHQLRKEVFLICKRYDIDISTPFEVNNHVIEGKIEDHYHPKK